MDSAADPKHDDAVAHIGAETATWFLVNLLLALVALTVAFGFAGLITFAVVAALLIIAFLVALTAAG